MLKEFLQNACQKTIHELYGVTVGLDKLNLTPTRKEFNGDLTLVIFPLTKIIQKNPEQIANEVGNHLQINTPYISQFEVVKGFLNLTICDMEWIKWFTSIIEKKNYGNCQSNGKKVMIEYSSPNTNKPLHLGHLRNIFIGHSVAEILTASGYEVIRANLVNDRGIHICKSMLAWKLFANGENPEDSGIKGDHLVGKYYVRFETEYRKQVDELMLKGFTRDESERGAPLMKEIQSMLLLWENKDTEIRSLWKKMNEWVYEGFAETYLKVGTLFDKYYYESETYLLGKKMIEEGLSKKVFYKKEDGSVWVDMTPEGLDQKLLLRNDGTSVYITQDLGTADLKYKNYKIDQSIYVIADEQDYHMKILKIILKKLNKSYAEGIRHLSYGMVDLPSGKMKSREGTVVDADELISEIVEEAEKAAAESGKTGELNPVELIRLYEIVGMGALKFYILKVEPSKRMLFSPTESIDIKGHTGPFVQYTYARIASVIRKWGKKEKNIMKLKFQESLVELTKTERSLLSLFLFYPEVLKNASEKLSPAEIANYTYELAKTFNHFYHESSILNEANENSKNFRLQLSWFVSNMIKKNMALLGIEVPEKM